MHGGSGQNTGLSLSWITLETPEPVHPVDSYRPHQSTTTLPLHSWSSTEGWGGWSVVAGNPYSWLAWVNPSHWSANSNWSSTTEESVLSPHKGYSLIPSTDDKGRLCHWTLKDTYYIRPHYQDTEWKQLYLIHRNKHREAANMKRQRNMAQMKEQIKTPEKEPNKVEISKLSDAEFKTGYKDARGI